MKFHRIDIEGFGVLSQLTLDGLDGRLNVVYGPNGAGKSTLLHFLQGVFCGYEDGRRLGLLPPVAGGPGGGAVQAHWAGEDCLFTRTDNAEQDNKLRVTLMRNGRQTAHPRFAANNVPTALIPTLYAVGHADAHDLDRLVACAIDDGIDLITRQENPDDLTSAASRVHAQRTQLIDEAERGRVAELTEQRQHLQAELEQLTRQLRERCEQLTRAHHSRQQCDREQARQLVQWLHGELQAAETDLREAEDRAWQTVPPRRWSPQVTVTRSPQPRPQTSTGHVDVNHRSELEEIDQRIAQARAKLVNIAERRLDVGLRAAKIAGSEDLQAEQLLATLRESLSTMEVSLLELQDDAHDLSHQRDAERCVCQQWATTTRTAVEDIRRRLYRICEQVSRFELHHNKSVLSTTSAQLDREEVAQLQAVKSLRERRQAIVESTGQLNVWHGPAQRSIEHELCECSDHWTHEESKATARTVKETTSAIVVEHPQPVVTIVRPTSEELRRFRQRRDQLRSQLEEASLRWRASRARASDFELPEDVRALEERIDQTRVELDTIEQELTNSQEQWRVLSVTGEVIRRVVERIEQDVRPPVIRWAAEYLSRLTGGRYLDLRVTPEHHDLRVIDEGGNERPRWTLSRGTLDQVALSLRLALVRAYAERSVRFPMVLDDVLVDCDIDRLQEAVRLLKEFATDHDQQIIYMTCGTHLASLFHTEGITPLNMPGSLSGSWQPSEPVERPANWTIRGWVDQQENHERVASTGGRVSSEANGPARATSKPSPPVEIIEEAHIVRVPERVLPTLPVPKTETVETTHIHRETRTHRESVRSGSERVRLARPLNRRQPGGQYWLSMDSQLMFVPSIGEQMGRRLAALSLQTVEELLDLPADEETVPLKTLQISESRLREWQAEALLLCCVPDLTGPDAQILVVCGIRDPQQLAEINVDQLVARLSRLSRDQWARDRQDGWPTRELVQRWIHNGRHSRSRESARHSWTGRSSTGHSSTRQRRSDRSSRGTRTTRSRTRSSDTERSSSDTERKPRANRAVITPFTAASRQSQTSSRSTADRSSEWKFYLSPESPVVDAPSIGPKMASRLETLGIITVSDLLARNAADVTERLDHKRVKEETVIIWQQQARLMCRIPQLRGHDAQVLVACEITQPEQVSRMDARALFGIVGPFVSTAEGKRLLRSSKMPDLEEVTDWINWANHARPLKAA